MILKVKSSIVLLIFFLVFTIPATPILIDSIIISITSVLALYVLFHEKPNLNTFVKIYYPLLLFFLILTIGLIYSKNLYRGFNQVEQKLTFVLFPIVFYSVKDIISYKKVLKYFAFGVLFSATICDLNMLYKFRSLSVGYSLLLKPLDIDPTYFSMYCLFAMTFFCKQLLESLPVKQKTLYIIILSYLTYFFLRIGSKIGLIIMFVLIGYTLIITLRYKPKTTNLIIVVILICFGIISYLSPITYNRFYRPLLDNNLDFYQLRMKFFNERYYAWKCSIEAVNIKSIWFGYGTGDDLDVLRGCYEGYRRNYVLNSHNIYFSSLIKNGILGLLSLFFIIIQGFKSNKIEYTTFSLIILFIGLTESILERQKGIIFFTLFCTLILTELQTKKENKCVEL